MPPCNDNDPVQEINIYATVYMCTCVCVCVCVKKSVIATENEKEVVRDGESGRTSKFIW